MMFREMSRFFDKLRLPADMRFAAQNLEERK